LGCDPKPAGGQPQSVLLQTGSALYSVYPLLFTLETRGHVCQIFHHPTLNSWQFAVCSLKAVCQQELFLPTANFFYLQIGLAVGEGFEPPRGS
jgi:hypothetical protein